MLSTQRTSVDEQEGITCRLYEKHHDSVLDFERERVRCGGGEYRSP